MNYKEFFSNDKQYMEHRNGPCNPSGQYRSGALAGIAKVGLGDVAPGYCHPRPYTLKSRRRNCANRRATCKTQAKVTL